MEEREMKSLTIPLDCARCEGNYYTIHICDKRLSCKRYLAGKDKLTDEQERRAVWYQTKPFELGEKCEAYWPMDDAK